MESNGPNTGTLRDVHFRLPDVKRTQAKPKRFGWLIAVVVLAAIGTGVYFFWFRGKATSANTDQTTGHARGGGVVPVVAATARQGDLPIYLNGLGTVTPLNLVTVRARVAGQIMRIDFTEGQDVKENDLLFEIDPRPFEVALEQAEGQLGRDQAALNNAQVDLTRYQSAGASVAQQQLDTAMATVREDEAIVKSDQAGIDSAKLNLVYCKITSPIDGRIGLKMVDVGNMVQANDTTGLAVITQLKPITVVFSISQDDAAPVLRRADGGVGLAVDAFDSSFTTQLATGTISAIDNQFNPSTDTIQMKATFKNDDHALFPSQFVNARLLVDTLHQATLVPAAAVQRGPDNQFVYRVKPDQSVEVRPVKIGQTTDDTTSIDDGVQPGDVVVTDGVDKLQPGSKVAVRERAGRGAATQPGATTQHSGRPTTRQAMASPGTPGQGDGQGHAHGQKQTSDNGN